MHQDGFELHSIAGELPDDFELEQSSFALSIITDDESVTRRVKAITATRPLHDLDRNRMSWGAEYMVDYDLLALAVATIDQVALSMGISTGLSHESAVTFCAAEAGRQHPDRDDAETRSVAERVIGYLAAPDPIENSYVDHSGPQTVRRDPRAPRRAPTSVPDITGRAC